METNIVFKQVNRNKIEIYRDEKKIGLIWSQKQNLLPYPHKTHNEMCKSSIQICGFDSCSEVFACGDYHGKKDLVLNFLPNTDYFNNKKEDYKKYIKRFMELNIDVSQLKSFSDWAKHDGYPSASNLDNL